MIVLLTVFFAVIISNYVKDKNLKIFGILVAMFLGFLAYHIEVLPTSDLFRHFEQIDFFREYGWKYGVIYQRFAENPLTTMMYWLFSNLNDNRWMPAIIVFVVYSLIFDLIEKVYKDLNYSRTWYTYCIFFVLLNFNFYNLVYAVRMWLVFAVFARCFYEECIRRKHRIICWSIYIALIFFHYASIILITCRFLAMVLNNVQNKKSMIKIFLLLIMGVIGVCYLYNSSVGDVLFSKVESYGEYDVRGTWQTINCWIKSVGTFVVVLMGHKRNNIKQYKEYYAVVLYIFLFMLCQFNNYQITLRFSDCMIILSGAIIPHKRKGTQSPFVLQNSQAIMLGVSIINLIYVCMFDYKFLSFIF